MVTIIECLFKRPLVHSSMQEELDVCIQAVVLYKKGDKGSYSVQETQRRYKEVLISYEIENLDEMSKISDENIGHIFTNSMDRELIEHLRFACGTPGFRGSIKAIIAKNYTVSEMLDDYITAIHKFAENMPKKKTFSTNAPPTHTDLRVLLKALQAV